MITQKEINQADEVNILKEGDKLGLTGIALKFAQGSIKEVGYYGFTRVETNKKVLFITEEAYNNAK